jgi:hypothetical protein
VKTLNQRELNRALLARQLLLERAKLPIPQVLERIAGLQAQYAPAMYVALWSRMEGLKRDALTRALERRLVVQATLMRATIHLVSKRDYWPLAVALRDPRRSGGAVHRTGLRTCRRRPGACGFLADGPRRRKEIEERLGRERALGVGVYLDLVRVPPSGTWEQRRADLYSTAEDWVGPENVTREEGLTLLVRRYLAAFGPASRRDIADWAMLAVADVDSARTVEAAAVPRREGQATRSPRAPLPPTRPRRRVPPAWDATLLVHAAGHRSCRGTARCLRR